MIDPNQQKITLEYVPEAAVDPFAAPQKQKQAEEAVTALASKVRKTVTPCVPVIAHTVTKAITNTSQLRRERVSLPQRG